MRTNLHHLLEERSKSHGLSPAITYNDVTYSYDDIWLQSVGVANGLRDVGMVRGDRIAIFLEKRTEAIAAIFGSSGAGCTFVPINPVLKPRQVSHIIANCSARMVVTSSDRFMLIASQLATESSIQHIVIVGDVPSDISEHLAAGVQVHLWTSLFKPTAHEVGHSDAIDMDVAAIFYTSGSTGSPKGVVLSHRNLIVGAESVSSYLDNTADDVILVALPITFDAGFSQVTTAFSVGAHAVLMNYLLAKDVARLCLKHGVTGLTCVPPLWIQIADARWAPEVAGKLRYFANTGGRMPGTLLARLRQVFPNAAPFLMYGLTEAFRSTFLDPLEVDRRPDSMGKAIPNAEVLVVRPDGTICDPGEEGELVHRGALVSLGYWNDVERTAERFRPAPSTGIGSTLREMAVWSGDIVVRDPEGFLYFIGRRDDMIKTSGYRVSPTEVEEVAYATGLVADAVALGADHPNLGHEIVLVVTAKDGDFDEQALLKEMRRALPAYMVPSRVIIKNAIERSPNGKFDRQALRAEL